MAKHRSVGMPHVKPLDTIEAVLTQEVDRVLRERSQLGVYRESLVNSEQPLTGIH